MALDETTRQVNKRAVAALEDAMSALGEADQVMTRACNPLDDLSRTTNAHDAVLEQMRQVREQVRLARHEVRRRFIAESEGE